MTPSLVRYQPFTELRRAMDRLFDDRFFAPYQLLTLDVPEIAPIDMYHTDSERLISA